jgi:hypothetical protein
MFAHVNWLAELARDFKVVTLPSHHLRKQAPLESDEITIDRLRGSSAITQPARLVWAIDTPNPQERRRKRLQVIKNNLGDYPKPLGFEIVDTKQGEITFVFGEPPEAPTETTKTEECADWLWDYLRGGEKERAEVMKVGKAQGFPERTIERAFKVLRVVSRIRDKRAWWGLPAQEEDIPF